MLKHGKVSVYMHGLNQVPAFVTCVGKLLLQAVNSPRNGFAFLALSAQ